MLGRSRPTSANTHERWWISTRLPSVCLTATTAGSAINRESGVAEVVIPPRSELIGASFFPGMVTSSGDLVVLAIQRGGEDRAAETTLAVGDTLLLQGDWSALDENLEVDPRC